MLRMVWDAYDDASGALAAVDWDEDLDDVERSVTEVLHRALQRRWREEDGFPPFGVQHGPFERESRSPSPAQPPVYDIAFILYADDRVMWPLEAKVLVNDRDTNYNLGDYVATINERYLTGYYAPFSNGGAMLAYLREGDPGRVTTHIGRRLSTSLSPSLDFPERSHSLSEHDRVLEYGSPSVRAFTCHHLVLQLGAEPLAE